ncbi:MAG: MFS transporter [Clostridia bacterium]|nr:MFS transporter [Clostridia bacterium]
MKLNVKRTALVGLAFMSISAFWQLYDFSVPLILKDTYAMGDTAAGAVMAMDNIVALFLLPLFGALSDRCRMKMGRRMPFMLFGGFAAALLSLAVSPLTQRAPLWAFLVLLALLLIAMATFRSPTVALMPDVTPKPLRSKANAVINLMGAIGGALMLLLTNFLLRETVNAAGQTVSDYTLLFMTVAFLLMAAMLVIRFVIPERRLAAETEAINRRLEADKPAEPEKAGPARKLSRGEMTSLVLILCSVSLWFMGYNAVTTAFSKYAIQVFEVQKSTAANCLLVGTVVAIISYWPVGVLSSKLGRKKMILGGIALLMAAFLCAGLLKELTFVAYILFALVGMGWASIGVNSYPMVVELASGSDVGKYTGYYYTFSMAAQVLTPILSGWLLEHVGYWTLFPYAFVMLTLAMLTMSRVRHGDSRPETRKGIEALDVED